ncbi:peptidoglycan DD-metalloendopeptidase family protein [Hymenobacter taeanensis]|uniref:Peptidoglycan DD-metalloendopeptidase family protein n=1 Tax=Hymenobacter taeanensis TaxID=2735321 RepID=A0A6M6BKC6_9BACT|nr:MULTISPECIES: M23 family metallopeptidase [Hymenobacter]QJX48490.1 peptidoglycan DD-metalloendopeptidase family protein [Hymenobacter taeanensis]UOQ82013.1 M23 family metallopeptidase [Hymenobacter sp. 5414T-23]
MLHRLRALPAVVLVLFLTACSQSQTLQGIFQKSTPHEEYARRLRQARLDETALGRDWLRAAEQALHDSLTITLPFQESGFFPADRATAVGYRYKVRSGETIHVSLKLAPGTDARVFLDAFELHPAQAKPTLLASADTTDLSFRYTASNDQQHVLRVQPELLRAGRYTLRVQREPSLSFPVRGKNDAAVGSFWGSDRDGGARRHEGIDIFAKRGTPAIAAANGFITRVNETNLGGLVVWLADNEHGQHLYYAHLDKQLVQPGQQVRIGDTLGLVGNTGNARTTNPHLHFGVYRSGSGAVDPFPFVRRADALPPAPRVAPERLGQWVRAKEAKLALHRSPAAKSKTVGTTAKPTPLLVLGVTTDWLRVQLPTGRTGFVPARTVLKAEPLRRESLAVATDLFALPQPNAQTLDSVPAKATVAVLGEFAGYRLVRRTNGRVGWLAPTAS